LYILQYEFKHPNLLKAYLKNLKYIFFIHQLPFFVKKYIFLHVQKNCFSIMTQRFTLLTLLSLLVFGACKKKETAPADWTIDIITSKISFDDRGITQSTREEGVTVYLYNGFTNYVADKPLTTQVSDISRGGDPRVVFVIPFKDITNADSLYFRAKKGNLNSIRDIPTGKLNLGGNPTSSAGIRGTFISISTTPTKLRLQVLDAGQRVQGASVNLYTTESAYLSNGGNVTNLGNNVTNTNGEVEFSGLEPRQYWFRVFKNTKNNNATTFKTSAALPDDANVTNVIQVGIQ
jgi:hypothetical protein